MVIGESEFAYGDSDRSSQKQRFGIAIHILLIPFLFALPKYTAGKSGRYTWERWVHKWGTYGALTRAVQDTSEANILNYQISYSHGTSIHIQAPRIQSYQVIAS